MYSDFAGKAAVVIGGTSGIGLGAARRLAQGGAKVVISGVNESDGVKAVDEMRNMGIDAFFKKADIRYSAEVESLIQFAVETCGWLDILVNSAGIQRYGDTVQTSEEVWDEVIDINLKGMFLACKYAIPEMRKAGKGAIVNVSSVQSLASQKSVVAYSASKGGINAMTRAMAHDHAHEQIRVNAVCPASIDTPMLRMSADMYKGEQSSESILAAWGNMHPVGRIGTIEEVGELIAFLCSERASFITGAEYKIDGGMLAALGVKLPE
ncbi:SDR family NAD(P)-dependent oxidoreductase [Paenibacillus radicis (ex Xue et al. 2023)]|uniref:SDR family oxidoreductase n=1 Tax=Paenibacillus radicis (ex Xue et al. 2023) TaxID=2972489 RepID=A0ABT1YQG6_9BACL|nr:SDR family NAD(P)-dependent oxidoreductase [Paenibacillus radicis (ex Xue et al. 2023)]MCR8634230.1 SDR family oxidoreductase [Paenibacillus radicis (ex Xue et al. 2023)]